MANTIQIKRGLEANRSSVTPAAGELLYTTDDKKVYVGDGTTAGGNQVGGGGAVLEATASGALANGDLVVVNSDGTVSVVAAVTEGAGSPTVIQNVITGFASTTYDANAQKVVIAYRDGDNLYGTAIVGTVSGTSISFGTPVVFESANCRDFSATYDANAQKIVISYQDTGNSSYGTAVVGTVSGTSISFGTPVVFESGGTTASTSSAYDANAQKVVIAYARNFGYAVVGTVSGTSISFGTPVFFESATTYQISSAYDSNAQKVVIAYRDGGNSNAGTAVVGTVSGTSISFGTPVVFDSGASAIRINYDESAQKSVITYADDYNSSYGTAVVGTVSGTSISFGSPVVFQSATTSFVSSAYDASAQKTVVAYRDSANSDFGTIVVGTVSGTSISFGSSVVFESDTTVVYVGSAVYDSASQKVVIAYLDSGNSLYGTAVVFQNAGTNLTATNYIGISDGAYADASTATVQIVGAVDDAQTGLTAGSQYYVQIDGTLSTTAGTPSVFAGTAISSTQLIVKG